MKYVATVPLLLLVLAGSAFGQAEPDEVIVYKKIADVELTLHVFNPDDLKATANAVAWLVGNLAGVRH